MNRSSKINIKTVLNASMDAANNTTTGGMLTKITKSIAENVMELVARTFSVLNKNAIARARLLTLTKMLTEELSDQLKPPSVTS